MHFTLNMKDVHGYPLGAYVNNIMIWNDLLVHVHVFCSATDAFTKV